MTKKKITVINFNLIFPKNIYFNNLMFGRKFNIGPKHKIVLEAKADEPVVEEVEGEHSRSVCTTMILRAIPFNKKLSYQLSSALAARRKCFYSFWDNLLPM